MLLIRRGFYLIMGFTFPGFWTFHASGSWSNLYKPIQNLMGSRAIGWPSFLTAILIYLSIIAVFEIFSRLIYKYRP